MSAIVDTTLPLGNLQLRYGMFDDAGGLIPGNVSGGTPWNGYFVGNATEGGAQGTYEKGPNGGISGQWWSIADPNSAPIVGRSTSAAGTYDDAAGMQSTPAGRDALSLEYTRMAGGMQIAWSTVQIDDGKLPSGAYSHGGIVLGATPASGSWTYSQLGFFLYGGSFPGTIIVDDVQIRFTNAVPEPSCTIIVSLVTLSVSNVRQRRKAT